MTKKEESILKLYAEKEEKIKELDTELAAMKPKVLNLLQERGVDTLQEEYGTFSVVKRIKWTYTKELVQKEFEYNEIIKSRKQEEQESGEAKAEESSGLSYRAYVPKTNEKEIKKTK